MNAATNILRSTGPVAFDVVNRTPDSVRITKEGFVSCDCPACKSDGEDLTGRSVHARGHSAVQRAERMGGGIEIVCVWCGAKFDVSGTIIP